MVWLRNAFRNLFTMIKVLSQPLEITSYILNTKALFLVFVHEYALSFRPH